MASAAFGLVSGSLTGGPLAGRLIVKHNLMPSAKTENEKLTTNIEETERDMEAAEREPIMTGDVLAAIFQFALSMSIGSVVYGIFLTIDVKVPTYLFALFAGIFVRNVAEFTRLYKVNTKLIDMIGYVSLSFSSNGADVAAALGIS